MGVPPGPPDRLAPRSSRRKERCPVFNVLTSGPRRRTWSPATIAASVGAHVLVLGGAVYAAANTPVRTEQPADSITWIPMDPAPPPPPPPVAPAPPRAVSPPDAPAAPVAPKPGDFVAPTPPSEIPSELPDIRLDVPAISDADVRGVGIRGDIVGTPVPGDDRPPTGATAPVAADGPVAIDAEGRVESGSVEVVSASHPAFAEAARQAAARFRFTPASVGGEGVRVVTTMPIRWALED